MHKKKIVVLGAGLTGLSAAWHLQKKGIDCQVFEKEAEVGGLCRSKTMGGFTFDYDGHLLHFKHPYVFTFIKGLLGENLVRHKRSAWVYSYKTYTNYPFQANLYGLPSPVIRECLAGFMRVHNNGGITNKNNLSFAEWIERNLGTGIARHFMVPYNTKFWSVHPRELTCEWLDGFIPVPSLRQVQEGALKANQRQFGYSAQFWYPEKGGINQIPLALASRIKGIYTDCRVLEINLSKKQIRLASGDRVRFDHLISTIPLPQLPYVIDSIPGEIRSLFKKLRWNSIFNLNLGLEKNGGSRRHWIYFPEKEFCFFRVGFFHNFSSSLAPPEKDSLYVEVAYSKEKPIDKSGIVNRIKNDLKKAGISKKGSRIYCQHINDIKYGYPIYDKYYSLARGKILRFLLSYNIFSGGRYGAWRYMSMEDAILEGKKISESLPR